MEAESGDLGPVGVSRAWTEQVRQGLRRELKLSSLRQGEVSRRLGMGDAYLANLFTTLRGRQPITLRLDTVLALLAILEIRPSQFFAELEKRGAWFGPEAEPAAPPPAAPPSRQPLQDLSTDEYEEVGRRLVALARTLADTLAPPASGRSRSGREISLP